MDTLKKWKASIRHILVCITLPLVRLFNPQFNPQYTSTEEVEEIIKLAEKTSGAILEIGCNTGNTTSRLAKHFPNRKVIGIDCTIGHKGDIQYIENPKNRIGYLAKSLSNVMIIDDDSKFLLSHIKNETVGFAFIDGNHSYEGVKSDTINCLKLIKRGIIVWHDYSKKAPYFIKVREYLEKEIADKYKLQTIEGFDNLVFVQIDKKRTKS